VLPRRSRPISGWERRLYRGLPPAQRLARAGIYWAREGMALGFLHPPVMRAAQRLARRHLAKSIPDPQLRASLTPDYTLGCKRVLLSNDYLPTLNRPNVAVIQEGIREVVADGIVTAGGARHEVDTIIFGTGFHVTDSPIGERVRGRDGRSLAEVWQGSPRAYLGTSVAGFPNLFLLLGPNTGLGHTSVVFMMECQLAHLLGAVAHLRRNGLTAIEPTPAAQSEFVAAVDRKMQGTVWLRGGCQSWYLDRTGRNSTIWPGQTFTFRRRLRRFDADDYQPVPVTVPA
jgi:cation diffusion facilitator CzcD-associated flavoprotein CzcO